MRLNIHNEPQYDIVYVRSLPSVCKSIDLINKLALFLTDLLVTLINCCINTSLRRKKFDKF